MNQQELHEFRQLVEQLEQRGFTMQQIGSAAGYGGKMKSRASSLKLALDPKVSWGPSKERLESLRKFVRRQNGLIVTNGAEPISNPLTDLHELSETARLHAEHWLRIADSAETLLAASRREQ